MKQDTIQVLFISRELASMGTASAVSSQVEFRVQPLDTHDRVLLAYRSLVEECRH
jgi:hypothetical protein